MSRVSRFDDPLVLNRFEAGHYDSDGRWVTPCSASIDITGCIQPAGPEDMQRLPEGFRSKKALRLYTVYNIRTANQATGTPADTFEWEGDIYEIQSIDKWKKLIPHYKAIATRIELEGAEVSVKQ
jgi:hypothetical protein